MVDRVRRRAGDRHGRLTLIEPTKKEGVSVRGWLCQCDCGNEAFVRFDCLKNTHSCGCLRKERGKARATHGAHGTKAYTVWQSMKKRCLNPQHPAYHNYGGRGIDICPEWLDFSKFLEDMGQPEQGMQLDRINNDLGYNPDNCRWASRREQANNRRTNVVTDGVTLAQAAELSGHSIQVLHYRIHKMGMTLQEAMQTHKLRKRNLNGNPKHRQSYAPPKPIFDGGGRRAN